MPENLFSNPEIDLLIKSKILRLQAASLEWGETPDGSSFDEHIVETKVATLDAHAEAYVCKVDRPDLISEYVEYLHGVGTALLRHSQQETHLMNPYSEDRLRMMAESTGHIISRMHKLTPEKYEAEVERCRSAIMPEALKWHDWKNQLLFRIETRFEARYRSWAAEAIERAQLTSKPPAVTVSGGNGKNPEPQFRNRASWLKDRLLERGWSNHDPSKYGGPDRKTIEKILRGEAVRNDVLEKLADALSKKYAAEVSVLGIPED